MVKIILYEAQHDAIGGEIKCLKRAFRFLAIIICVVSTTTGFAVPATSSALGVEETIYPNGDRVWHINENGRTSIIFIYHDRDYILVDGEKIIVDEEISVTYSEEIIALPQRFFASANPVWVYIYSQSVSAETTKKFNTYAIGALAALLAVKLGLGYAGGALMTVATIAVTDYVNEQVMDLECDTYGNQNNLNYYKYVDSFYISGDFIPEHHTIQQYTKEPM